MKWNKCSKVILAVMVLVLSLCTLTAAAKYDHQNRIYTEDENTKIIDNVVYGKVVPKDKKAKPYYKVESFSPTEKIAKTMTKINIVSQIDGIPVTEICGTPVSHYEPPHVYVFFNPPFMYPNVTTISIPDSVEIIDDGAFVGLTNIEAIRLPKNLKELGAYAFYKLDKITQMTIPKGVDKIKWSCFNKCVNLRSVIFEGDIQSIEETAFYACRNLKSITSCPNLVKIGDLAFWGCSALPRFSAGDKLETIGEGAFIYCTKIKSFYFPQTLKELGEAAFYSTGLTSAVIPSKTYLDSGDEGLFQNCKNLKTVVFENRKDTFYIPDYCFDGCTNLETVVLPSSAKIVIFPRAFRNCTKLTNLVNTGRIDHIFEAAFANCTSLQSIKFSSMIKVIEKKAFQGCKNLTSVTFADKSNIPGTRYNKLNCFDPKTFSGTPAGMKFYVKNATVAKKLKTALKGSGVNDASIYYSASNKLVYKNVK
ncbi:MAG: leucine-rich repeat domain-containing protein [Acutalibacteraceae bacterium]